MTIRDAALQPAVTGPNWGLPLYSTVFVGHRPSMLCRVVLAFAPTPSRATGLCAPRCGCEPETRPKSEDGQRRDPRVGLE